MQTILQNGTRAVVITNQNGHIWANLYVNARNGLQDASICPSRWTGKTMAGATKWAKRQLGVAS